MSAFLGFFAGVANNVIDSFKQQTTGVKAAIVLTTANVALMPKAYELAVERTPGEGFMKHAKVGLKTAGALAYVPGTLVFRGYIAPALAKRAAAKAATAVTAATETKNESTMHAPEGTHVENKFQDQVPEKK